MNLDCEFSIDNMRLEGVGSFEEMLRPQGSLREGRLDHKLQLSQNWLVERSLFLASFRLFHQPPDLPP